MELNSPTRRVILLGASNLTRSFPTVVAAVRRTWDEPIEIMAAMGYGRSYGQDSTVLGRKISGIFPCALWQDLQRRAPLPTTALVTDIGNDLLYNVPPDRLLKWVAGCLDRLAEVSAATIVTQLPIGSVERLSERRFLLLRRALFPRSRLTFTAAKDFMRALNAELISWSEARKISVISVSDSWYGIDSIHLRRRIWQQAWPMMLAAWSESGEPIQVKRPSLWTSAYLASLAPWERSLFGIRRRAPQPCGRFSDGTTIALY